VSLVLLVLLVLFLSLSCHYPVIIRLLQGQVFGFSSFFLSLSWFFSYIAWDHSRVDGVLGVPFSFLWEPVHYGCD